MVCICVWGELKQSMLVEDACKPKHLLWVLIFLKTYTTESSLAVAIGVDEKTLQKWIFIIIYAISDLEHASSENKDIPSFRKEDASIIMISLKKVHLKKYEKKLETE